MMRAALSLLFFAACTASGQARANTPPADSHVVLSTTVVRGEATPRMDLWNGASGGSNTAEPTMWGRVYWVCHSASDPATGACRSEPEWHADPPPTVIQLQFTERQSGLSANLEVHGHVTWHWNDVPCEKEYGKRKLMLDTGLNSLCQNAPTNDEKRLTVWFPEGELGRLPAGGIWTANLRLRQGSWHANPAVAAFTAAITVVVTDDQSMQVYLPDHDSASPTVDLDLRSQMAPGGVVLWGERVVDACLYDGYNGNSQRYTVRIDDPASQGDEAGRFFVRHVTHDVPPRNRIEYTVSSTTGGLGTTDYVSGQVRVYDGIPGVAQRLVHLPHLSQAVICTPWPLTLRTPEFALRDKTAGDFEGTLRIEFSASTTAP